jgi:hypothetical protein
MILDFEKLRIRYKKISRLTNLDSRRLFDNIFVELDKPGYVIVKQNENSIEFRHNIWRFGSNMNALSYIDGGCFEIDSQNKMISFSFYYSLVLDIFMNSFALAFVLFVNDQSFFVNICFLILGLIRFIWVRQNAVKMIEKIANSE